MIFGAAGMSMSMAVLAGATSNIGNTSLGLLAVGVFFASLKDDVVNIVRLSSSLCSTRSLPLVGSE